MKPIPLVFLAVIALVASVRSQEEESPASGAPAAAPLVLPTAARILGDIPDGTPPAPQPSKPVFVVPASDILATTTQQQGGRTITIQRIKPIALPPPPEPAPIPLAANDPALQERLAELQEHPPKSNMVMLGATVYRFKDAPPRTLVTYWREGGAGSVTFWSSADFALLSGVSSFVATDGDPRTLFLMWSGLEVDRLADLLASSNQENSGPALPVFPDGPATFIIDGEQPDAETLVPIQSLHDLYNSEYARLKTAWEGRERERIAHEAWLKAHPPQPKNIVLNYWRTERPAPAQGANK